VTVCFVVLNEMLTGVVPSQVVAPARAYAAELPDVAFRIAFLEPARVVLRSGTRRRLEALRRLWPEGAVGLYPYIGRLGDAAPAITLEAVTRAAGTRRRRVVFHCRGPEATLQAARVAARLEGARVVFDARGASGPEAVVRLAARNGDVASDVAAAAYESGAALDRRAAERADAVVAVSEPLLRDLVGDGHGRESGVIPCCVDRPHVTRDTRRAIRESLGIADELLLVHTSTEARWEAFDQVIALLRAVREHRAARLLFLTTLGADVVTSALGAADPLRGDIIVRRAEAHEVPGYLSAADVGVLLRRLNDAQRVASPIKFAEYLGAGLALAVTRGVGAIGDVVEREGLGVVVDADTMDFQEAAQALLHVLGGEPEGLRQRAIRVCEERYSWQRYVPVVSRLYGLS
jgi:glycosyltransferase involved in cell wall biosynthesis